MAESVFAWRVKRLRRRHSNLGSLENVATCTCHKRPRSNRGALSLSAWMFAILSVALLLRQTPPVSIMASEAANGWQHELALEVDHEHWQQNGALSTTRTTTTKPHFRCLPHAVRTTTKAEIQSEKALKCGDVVSRHRDQSGENDAETAANHLRNTRANQPGLLSMSLPGGGQLSRPWEFGVEELKPSGPHRCEDGNYRPKNRDVLLCIIGATRSPLFSGEKGRECSTITTAISRTTTGSGTSTLGATAERSLNLFSSLFMV